ncbi:hypothetical protein Bca52824_077433 [Brassica carinata]|uniref:Uncharacterized protein n=1 Tax=Brassica carinata TaxID=52824 RepID=A0A8X7PTJ7_BRACI|nr:hypothetical protein Bca52824_077433 [Brassica carinata]
MELKGNSSISSDRKTNKKIVASSATANQTSRSTARHRQLCYVLQRGTNTKDRVKFRIHKQVTDLFSALDVVKQITSITIEPGIEDKFNTSES